MTMRRHSLALIGPSSFKSCLINSLPPSMASRSGGITFIIMKYKAIDISIDHGAAYKNHSPQDTL